jgi:S1-C subfamily serine protease
MRPMMLLGRLAVACFGVSVITLTVGFALPVRSEPPSESVLKPMSVPTVVATVRPSVVTIITRASSSNNLPHATTAGSGSGFVIDDKGFILTNNHLVEGGRNLVVGLPTGKLTPGRVIARDFLLDLALIKIESKDLVAAPLGQSSGLQVGETVVAIGTVGNPLAKKGSSTVTIGVVSAVDQAILPPNGETLYDLIQTDAAINPGNSGGPLVDLSGRVVGITVAVAPSAQAISYAISMDAVYPHIKAMLVRGSVLRPDLGFTPVTVTPSVAASFNLYVDRGVLAAQVQPAKLAAASGLQDGDVITAIDQTPIYNMGDFWHAFLQGGEQFPAQLTVYSRNGQFTDLALPRVPASR